MSCAREVKRAGRHRRVGGQGPAQGDHRRDACGRGGAEPLDQAVGHPGHRRERGGQDHHDRQARRQPQGGRQKGAARRGGHLPRGGDRTARHLGRTRRGSTWSSTPEGSDPAAVVFDAITAGKARGVDVVICDTAGPPPQQKEPHGRAGAKSPASSSGKLPAATPRCCSCSTRPPGRTRSTRRAQFKEAAGHHRHHPHQAGRHGARRRGHRASSRNCRSRSNTSAWASRSTICGPLTRRTLSTPSSGERGRKRRRTRDEGDRRDREHGQARGNLPASSHRWVIEPAAQSEVCPGLSVEETGTTFAENAFLKADAVHERTGLAAVADDSGLCVDALDGAPGVYSARYAGEETPYPEKISQPARRAGGGAGGAPHGAFRGAHLLHRRGRRPHRRGGDLRREDRLGAARRRRLRVRPHLLRRETAASRSSPQRRRTRYPTAARRCGNWRAS